MTMPSADRSRKPPSTFDIISDRAFRRSTLIIAWFMVALMFWLVVSIGKQAMPAVRAYGLSFLTGSTWDANKEQFGILPAITGTMYSSVLGLAIGTDVRPRDRDFSERGFSLLRTRGGPQSGHLDETRPLRSLPDRLEDLLKVTIELLAAIPSVVYGLWGIFVIIPLVRP